MQSLADDIYKIAVVKKPQNAFVKKYLQGQKNRLSQQNER